MIKYVAFALAIVVALQACASDWDWDMRSGSPTAHRGRVAYYHRKHHPRPRVMAYERRSVERAERQDEDGGGKCVEKVRGLGTQWIGTKGALDAAKKDWMERVRYDHGESFVDMTNAKDFESRCGRVSIGEVAGQVTYRCEIVARPCKAPLMEASGSKKSLKDD